MTGVCATSAQTCWRLHRLRSKNVPAAVDGSRSRLVVLQHSRPPLQAVPTGQADRVQEPRLPEHSPERIPVPLGLDSGGHSTIGYESSGTDQFSDAYSPGDNRDRPYFGLSHQERGQAATAGQAAHRMLN